MLAREAKTGTKKQKHAGEHPARDPWHRFVRAKHNPRRATALRMRVQPPTPQPAPAPAQAPTKTSPHTPGRAAETPGAPRALHYLSHPSTPTAGGSRVPATTATVLHVAVCRATWPYIPPESPFDREGRAIRWHSKARHSGNKNLVVCPLGPAPRKPQNG